jgi:hypothetical protein
MREESRGGLQQVAPVARRKTDAADMDFIIDDQDFFSIRCRPDRDVLGGFSGHAGMS